MATPRKVWPEVVDGKRIEAQQLADEASRLIAEGSRLLNAGRATEAQVKFAEARAMNERIGRLMTEARHP